MNNPNPSYLQLESRIEQLESACEDLTTQSNDLRNALKEAVGWLNNPDVKHLIGTKLGEQAALHSTLNKSRQILNS